MASFDTAGISGQPERMVDISTGPADSLRQRGGRIPGSAGQPAWSLTRFDPPPIPVLIAAPHGGRTYPADLAGRMRHAAAASLRLEDRFTDLLAEAVARETGATLLVAHAPRAMIDLNRSPEDMDWEMVAGGAPDGSGSLAAGRRARSGLGLVPRRLPGMGELWSRLMTREDLEARIAHVHRSYHAALAAQLEALRDRWGAALLLDLHSMPPLGPKTGRDAAPDFVIGDRFGAACDSALAAVAFDHFAASRRPAAHNRPYAGGYVLDRHAAPARALHAMQVEVCRTAYLDSHMQDPGPGMVAVVEVLAGLVRRLAGELAAGARAQAAE
ncbi:N-formylglutamate amidohydrolase [Altererythrobacter sp. B11]|uniref:N-formylglutamate amidohydrolase n=1 Tax=Altererythrobacter sp. B11 TaxID=2060312 RepID=UPI000DC6E8A7|nr:N-formylglutamate amidohydrolase [Altererythrobacter sp. B11]BBC72621.1 N-formylglutamate amidohydrolase [Altererythrobacter sp. B11]